MKLLDAMRIKGGKFEIPDCSRNDLPAFLVEMGCKVGAEIGVWKGRFAKQLLDAGLGLFAIDSWTPYWEGAKRPGWLEDTTEAQEGFYKIAQWRLTRYRRCSIIRKTSMEAVKDFEDGSLDFVYLDGNHTFKHIAADIYEWTKKVRKGGVVSGHDYVETLSWNCQVPQVVDAYVEAFGIDTLYVIGSPEPVEGEFRDRARSWMFING